MRDNQPARIAIIDDDQNYSRELKSCLDHRPGIDTVEEFVSIEDFLKTGREEAPDVVLLDNGLPGMDGIAGIMPIKALFPFADIIMMTVFSDSNTIFRALYAGATGYIQKESEPETVYEAIVLTLNGGSFMSPSIARKVIDHFSPFHSAGRLTLKEQQVVHCIVEGLSYKLIADRLGIKIATVQGYIKSIYKKLDVHSKTEVIHKVKKAWP